MLLPKGKYLKTVGDSPSEQLVLLSSFLFVRQGCMGVKIVFRCPVR